MGMLTDTQSLFSRNMRDIVTSLDGEAYAPIVVHSEGRQTMAFVLHAVNDLVTIHTSEIVDNLAEAYNPYLDNTEICSQELSTVSIETRNESDEFTVSRWAIRVLCGGYDTHRLTDEYDFLQHNFLTWRPQTDFVVPGIKQQLSFVICNTGADPDTTYPAETVRRLYAKIYFRNLPPIVKELAYVGSNLYIYRLDCSYDRIASLVADLDDEVVAYDIYGGIDSDDVNCIPIKPQRFVVCPQSDSYSHFFFQNSLGGFDTIIARGEFKCIADGEIVTARMRNTEIEVTNDYLQSWEVNTGYITTAQEENLWHEFLRSTNRYILFGDGSYRKIIVEEYKAERVKLEVDSFTFKFHYAEVVKGSFAEKSETLPDFFIK